MRNYFNSRIPDFQSGGARAALAFRTKNMKLRLDKSTGYLYYWDKEKQKKFWWHRLVVEKELGRKLTSEEVVHHKDGVKQNNNFSNLEVTTYREHVFFHKKRGKIYNCEICGKENKGIHTRINRFCSRKCTGLGQRKKKDISDEEIISLLKEKTIAEVARICNVSWNAMKKRKDRYYQNHCELV